MYDTRLYFDIGTRFLLFKLEKKQKKKKNIKHSFKQEISTSNAVRRHCSRKKNFETHSSRTVEKSINSNVALLDTDSDGSLVVPMIFIYEKTVRERSIGAIWSTYDLERPQI